LHDSNQKPSDKPGGIQKPLSAPTIDSICIFAFELVAQEDDGIHQKNTRMKLEELVLTEQKRSENIRDVPISISLLSAELLRDTGIENCNDMARFMPNFTLNDGSYSMYVRGIGTRELDPIGQYVVACIVDVINTST
jgi:outer membrane receptor protein involved in Fe transport